MEISRKTVPKNELLSFKLALQNLYQIAINLSVRKELRFMPLKLNILGDSLCSAALFLFPGKRSVLQNNVFNIVSDLMQKILKFLPRAFINFSYIVGELNSADQNSKIHRSPINALNSDNWRLGFVINHNSITSHALVIYQKSVNNTTTLKLPRKLVTDKQSKDPLINFFYF